MAVSPEVATLFLEELARRNIAVVPNDEGGYVLGIQETITKQGDEIVDVQWRSVTVSLDNLSRDFSEDRDIGRISRFVDACTKAVQVPTWEEAEPRIRWQAESADMTFGTTITRAVSDKVVLALVCVDPSEMQIMWVGPDLLAHWGKTAEELWAIAARNMAGILRDAKMDLTEDRGHAIGMLHTQLIAFKAALLFSPALKDLVEPVLGWPVFAVAPCRDFVYVIGHESQEIFNTIGGVTVQQHSEGAYPISTEVFQISDEGVEAIGEFQRPPQEEEDSEDDLKTIHYRGGIVTFRIPAHWEEEYEEDGGGTFYDEDCEGTLRLNVITVSSRDPVTTHSARQILESSREPNRSEIIDLGNGNAMITYVQEAEGDGESMTWQFWQIANPVPPKHIRVVLFSYAYPTDLAEDDEIRGQLAMLDREIRACSFADTVGS
jgi:hypothetical protein